MNQLLNEPQNEQEQRPVIRRYSARKLKLLLVAVIAIALAFLAMFLVIKKYQSDIVKLNDELIKLSDPTATYTTASVEVSLSVIESQIKNISELATIEYLYTDAGKFSDPKQLFGHDIPFTEKSFIAKWDGVIKAGVDLSQVSTALDTINNRLTVFIPQAEILSHEIDSENIETLDEKNGLFNPIKIDDVRDFDAVSKESMEERAIENGLLDKAQKSAEEIITQLITANQGDVAYEIIFQIVHD